MKIGLVGLGAIGGFLCREIAKDERFEIVAVSEINDATFAEVLADVGLPGQIRTDLENLIAKSDVVVEAASASISRDVAEKSLRSGKTVIIASVGGLGEIDDLIEIGEKYDGRLLIPTGAIAGLDALKAIPKESFISVKMISTKHPKNFAGTEYAAKMGLELNGITGPVKIFDGSARGAAKAFPKSANVGAALALTTIGLDDVRVEIWANPNSDKNCHRILAETGHGRIETYVENVPFEENPKTSKLAAYSILATVKNLVNPCVTGT